MAARTEPAHTPRLTKLCACRDGWEGLVIPARVALDPVQHALSLCCFGARDMPVCFAAGLEEPAALVADVLNTLEDAKQ